MESLQEIKQFLEPTSRLDLKDVATTYILSMIFNHEFWGGRCELKLFLLLLVGLTASKEGQELLYQCKDIIVQLIKLTQDGAATVAKNSLLSLVNLSAEAEGASVILEAV